MKKLLVILVAISMLVVSAGLAMAANNAVIEQNGDDQTALIGQKDGGGSNDAKVVQNGWQNKVVHQKFSKFDLNHPSHPGSYVIFDAPSTFGVYQWHGTNKVRINQNGDRNVAMGWQNRGTNDADVDQNGTWNKAAFQQAHYGNYARILQNGYLNRSFVDQDGTNEPMAARGKDSTYIGTNKAMVEQNGSENRGAIFQKENPDDAKIEQNGWSNRALIHQDDAGAGFCPDGNSDLFGNNLARVLQNGDDNEADIYQYGQDNDAHITQNGYANIAKIKQQGELNDADIIQNGPMNDALILQCGMNNTALITQNGWSNEAVIQQN